MSTVRFMLSIFCLFSFTQTLNVYSNSSKLEVLQKTSLNPIDELNSKCNSLEASITKLNNLTNKLSKINNNVKNSN